MALEVHVEKEHLGSMLSGQSETLFRARGFEDVPALGRERHSRDRAQSRVIVRDKNGRRVGTSSSAERAETYVVGLVRDISGSLLALPNPGSSGTLVAVFISDTAVPLKICSFSAAEKSIPSIELTDFSIDPSRWG